MPEAALDLDGFGVGVGAIELAQAVNVAPVEGAGRAEVFLYCDVVGGQVVQRGQGLVAEPFIEGNPILGLFQHEGVGKGGVYRAGAGPAEQPILAVGQHAHADALAGLLGFGEVVVQLPDVFRVGVESADGSQPALDFDEGVQGGEVNGAAGTLRRRVFLHNLLSLGQAGVGEEVAYGAGDVGLVLAGIVPVQDGGGSERVLGVVGVEMNRHRGSWVGVDLHGWTGWTGLYCLNQDRSYAVGEFHPHPNPPP